jgi:peroxiredoxin
MDTKFKQIISLLCVLVISGLAVADCGTCGVGDQHEHKDDKKACPSDCQKACCATQTAPDFTLKDVTGKAVQLSTLKGKTVVLEWTNYDCPFVKQHYDTEFKTMSKLAAKYADQGVVWLTINSTHYATVETNKAWAEKHQLIQAVLVDSDGKVGKLYQAKTTPHMFVIDKEGKIAYEGAIDNAPMGKKPEGQDLVNYVDKALTELLLGKKVEIAKTKPYGCSVKYAN